MSDMYQRYVGKSDPYIVMVSIPNAPDGLFEHMEKEEEETCIYKRLFLDYTYGLAQPLLNTYAMGDYKHKDMDK